MKFGKKLTRKLVPEWQDKYMNYKELKRQIKKIVRAREQYVEARKKLREITGLAQNVEIDVSLLKEDLKFYEMYERNLETCEEFYHEQLDAAQKRFYELIQQLVQLSVIEQYTPQETSAQFNAKKAQKRLRKKKGKQKRTVPTDDEGLSDVSLSSSSSSDISDEEEGHASSSQGHKTRLSRAVSFQSEKVPLSGNEDDDGTSSSTESVDELLVPRIDLADWSQDSANGIEQSIEMTTELLTARKSKAHKAIQDSRAKRTKKFEQVKPLKKVVSSRLIFKDKSVPIQKRTEPVTAELTTKNLLDLDHEELTGVKRGPDLKKEFLVIDMSSMNEQSLKGDEIVVFPLPIQDLDIRKKALKALKTAFREYYRGLHLLEQFCLLNAEGFDKALKKHDKQLGTAERSGYFAKVRRDHRFIKMEMLQLLKSESERMFCTAFSSGSRRKGMKKLRVLEKRPGLAWSNFRLGLFGGMSIIFVIIIISLWLALKLYDENSPLTPERFNSMFIVYRMLFLVILMLWMWGFDAYIWSQNRVNYAFIFQFDNQSHIRWQNLVEAAACFTVIWLLSFTLYLLSAANAYPFGWLTVIPYQVFPFSLFLLVILVLLIHQIKANFWLAKVLWRIVRAPTAEIRFADFYIADQLCSLVLFFNDLEYSICFFITDAWDDSDQCTELNPYIKPFIAALPYLWRLLQCLRKYRDTKDTWQNLNALKYFTSIMIVLTSTLRSFFIDTVWTVLWVGVVVTGTIYSTFWDIKKDWSLGDPNAKHKFLRDRIIYAPWAYYLAMPTNLVMRMMWTFTISPSAIPIREMFFGSFLACVEIIRRGQWNLYRLENEQLNNIGKFRATRDVKLKVPVSEYQYELQDFTKLQTGVKEY